MTPKQLTALFFASLLLSIAIDPFAEAGGPRALAGSGSLRSEPTVVAGLIESWGRPRPGRVLAGPGLIDIGDPLASGTLVARGTGFGSDIGGDLEIQNLGDTDVELFFNSGTQIAVVPAGAHVHLTQVTMWDPEWIEYRGLGNGSRLQFLWAWSYLRP